jgi:hypothetical protein
MIEEMDKKIADINTQIEQAKTSKTNLETNFFGLDNLYTIYELVNSYSPEKMAEIKAKGLTSEQLTQNIISNINTTGYSLNPKVAEKLREINRTQKNRPHLTTSATYFDRPPSTSAVAVSKGGRSRKRYKRGNKKLIRKSLRKYKRVYTSKIRK